MRVLLPCHRVVYVAAPHVRNGGGGGCEFLLWPIHPGSWAKASLHCHRLVLQPEERCKLADKQNDDEEERRRAVALVYDGNFFGRPLRNEDQSFSVDICTKGQSKMVMHND